jgi:nicotinate-nucleotide adenylyltransferase
VNLAVQAKNELGLDKMLIMPTGTSPHKGQAKVGFHSRVTLCKLAFSHLPGFEVTDIEGKTAGNSYTFNSLRLLKKQYPKDAAFYLLIGADMLFSFTDWHNYEALLKECNVVAAAREPGQLPQMTEHATEIGRIKVLNLDVTKVSSSEIRERIMNGEDASELVPKKVLDYIKDRKFYAEQS